MLVIFFRKPFFVSTYHSVAIALQIDIMLNRSGKIFSWYDIIRAKIFLGLKTLKVRSREKVFA